MDFLSDRDRLEAGEFRDLIAWQRAMDLSVAIYQATDGWPWVDPLDLVQEMRRNAVILPSIVARGFGSGDRSMMLDCLQTALDTARQLDAQLALAVRIGYSPADSAEPLRVGLAEVAGELESLQRRYATSVW